MNVQFDNKIEQKYKGFSTQIPQSIAKRRMQPQDIGILVYILSNRIDARTNRWQLYQSEVIHHFKGVITPYQIHKSFMRLQERGFLIKVHNRTNGRFAKGSEWIVVRHPSKEHNLHIIRSLNYRTTGFTNIGKTGKVVTRNVITRNVRTKNVNKGTNMNQANKNQQNIDQKNIQQRQLPKISNQKSNNGSMQTRSYAVAQTPNRDSYKAINRSLKYRSTNIQDSNDNKKKKEPKGNETSQEDHLTDQELSEIDSIMSLIHQQFHITPTKSDWDDVRNWCHQYGPRIVGYGIDYTINQATKGPISNPVHYITAVLAHGWYYKYLKQAKAQRKTNQKMKNIKNIEELNAESRICRSAINNYKGRQSNNVFQHKSTDMTMKQASAHNVNYKQLYEKTFTPVEDTQPQDETALKIQAIYRNFDQLGIYSCGASFALAFLVNDCWSLNDIKIEFKHVMSEGYKGLKAMDDIRSDADVSLNQK